TNDDFIGTPDPVTGNLPTWKIYNTGSVIATNPSYIGNSSYKGPYQYGNFSYWESTETYPCNTDVWGDLAGQPIRHHKFPDVSISPIFETSTYTPGSIISPIMENRAIFPIGVRLDMEQISQL